jgi:DNA-binding response OmpR family regulator
MKHVLIIDESPHLRNFLQERLSQEDIHVTIATNGLEGSAKMRAQIPDLVIIDYEMKRYSCMSVLTDKKMDANAAAAPVLIIARKVDQKQAIQLASYNVKKIVAKPIQIDLLLKAVSDLLTQPLNIDDTPCILEAHVNDDILFIELARGLNRDKLGILRYKIGELVDLYQIKTPRVIVLLSDIQLSFADATNLELLLTNITATPGLRQKHIRILTKDDFIIRYIRENKDYKNIAVESNLHDAIEGLLDDLPKGYEYGEKKAEILSERVLSAENTNADETVRMNFKTETDSASATEMLTQSGKKLSLAIVDDDFVIKELIQTAFSNIPAEFHWYEDGQRFLDIAGRKKFDLVFLDIIMPKVDGYEVLRQLHALDIKESIIVLSAINTRKSVVTAFEFGVKSYLAKPLQPSAILRKAAEILGMSV